MNKHKHTPKPPFGLTGVYPPKIYEVSSGRTICTMSLESLDGLVSEDIESEDAMRLARMIVRAVNSHGDLMGQLASVRDKTKELFR